MIHCYSSQFSAVSIQPNSFKIPLLLKKYYDSKKLKNMSEPQIAMMQLMIMIQG